MSSDMIVAGVIEQLKGTVVKALLIGYVVGFFFGAATVVAISWKYYP